MARLRGEVKITEFGTRSGRHNGGLREMTMTVARASLSGPSCSTTHANEVSVSGPTTLTLYQHATKLLADHTTAQSSGSTMGMNHNWTGLC